MESCVVNVRSDGGIWQQRCVLSPQRRTSLLTRSHLFSAALLAFFSTASAFAIDLLFNLASALDPAVAILAWVTSSVALSASVCVIVVRSSNCLSCLSCSSDSALDDDEAPHFCRYCERRVRNALLICKFRHLDWRYQH